MATRKTDSSSSETQADNTPDPTPQQASEQSTSQVKPPPQASTVTTVEWQGQPQRTNATPAETGEAQEDAADEKTFKQSDLDAIVANRLKREKAEQDKLAKELQKVSQELQKYQDAEKTETEKQAERLAQLETENRTLAERNRQMAIDQELSAAASKASLPIDAALKLADRNALELDDDGRVTNAAEIIKAVAESYPGLVARAAVPPSPTINSSRSQQSGKPSDAELRQRYFGSGGGNFWQSGGVLMPADES